MVLKNKLMICSLILTLSMGLLVGARGDTESQLPPHPIIADQNFSAISQDAMRFSLYLFPENDSESNPGYGIHLNYNDQHFNDLLDIFTKYRFDKTENLEPIFYDKIQPHRRISLSIYKELLPIRKSKEDWDFLNYDPVKEQVLDVQLSEMGELIVNDFIYHMEEDGMILVNELFDYVERNTKDKKEFFTYAEVIVTS